ncbi:NAD(+)/NADH kinase [Fervidicoccus fontis]|uniref:NAD(+)/NADH kinase n=1 Tax=Fervidicoccus fontis TaxID=683846 RepID=A0A843A9T4_9CREN|nr:NAD(+)/NADH kinase [Fervidicoccus fontis]MBE9391643.1 NAD(+)/NADH kinase [Fervidicoccus fontis]
MKLTKIGFLANPIAGLGGALALKGSDDISWNDLGSLIGPGYKKALLFALILKERLKEKIEKVEFLVPDGMMGEDIFKRFGLSYTSVCSPNYPSTNLDTKNCAMEIKKEGAEVFFISGGDGTVYDVYTQVKTSIPIVGIPSGTKMYSSIFAKSINAAAILLEDFINENYVLEAGEILLVDENTIRENGSYRELFRGIAYTIESKNNLLHQQTKDLSYSEEESLEEIAEYVNEIVNDKVPLIIGPGRTCSKIAQKLNIKKDNVLSVAAGYKGKTYCSDCNSLQLSNFVDSLDNLDLLRIIVSPLGNSGYLFGRGNLQITGYILSKITIKNLLIVGSRNKMSRLKSLLIDIPKSNKLLTLSGYTRAIVGYEEEVVIKVELA